MGERADDDVSTDDLSIESYSSLLSPLSLRQDLPLTTKAARFVSDARHAAASIISRNDDRLMVL